MARDGVKGVAPTLIENNNIEEENETSEALHTILLPFLPGPTLSHLHRRFELTKDVLEMLLETLRGLHCYEDDGADAGAGAGAATDVANDTDNNNSNSKSNTDDDNTISWIGEKVRTRFTKYRSIYDHAVASMSSPHIDLDAMHQKLQRLLSEVSSSSAEEMSSAEVSSSSAEEEGGKRISTTRIPTNVQIIHGDPVFTNAILTPSLASSSSSSSSSEIKQIKLIDPRGLLGERYTTEGSPVYDLSKVYQSLIGYDHIIADILSSTVPPGYTKELESVFWTHVRKYYGEVERAVKIVTASHFFSIVPLHEDVGHRRRFLVTAVKGLEAL